MIKEIEPGSSMGDMLALYESFFSGCLQIDMKTKEADISKVIPIHPDHSHLAFLKTHLVSLGYTITGEANGT